MIYIHSLLVPSYKAGLILLLGKGDLSMFNRGSFNRIAFNREFSVFVFGSAVLRGEGNLKAGANVIATGSALLKSEGNMKATFVREVSFAATMTGDGGMKATFIRERLHQPSCMVSVL
jgi:hypothetical protein